MMTHFLKASTFSQNCKHETQYSGYIHKTSDSFRKMSQNSFICTHNQTMFSDCHINASTSPSTLKHYQAFMKDDKRK